MIYPFKSGGNFFRQVIDVEEKGENKSPYRDSWERPNRPSRPSPVSPSTPQKPSASSVIESIRADIRFR